MPTTTKESLGPTRVRLSITVTPEELKPSLDHAYQHIAEQIQIPGFRKGKVPPPLSTSVSDAARFSTTP